jgi:hypothetical protein
VRNGGAASLAVAGHVPAIERTGPRFVGSLAVARDRRLGLAPPVHPDAGLPHPLGPGPVPCRGQPARSRPEFPGVAPALLALRDTGLPKHGAFLGPPTKRA